jgi:hypothetical protein
MFSRVKLVRRGIESDVKTLAVKDMSTKRGEGFRFNVLRNFYCGLMFLRLTEKAIS